jgi:hypothetical protein
MPPYPFSLRRRAYYPLLFLVLLAVIAFIALSRQDWDFKTEHLWALLLAAAAFVHFLYQQHSSGTERFIQLFEAFNRRYDEMNKELNAIADSPDSTPLSADEIAVLYDYFNLCAEEFLFYDAGYIDDRVWESWRNGMKHFFCKPRIARVWASERAQNSYYGFVPPRCAA